MSADIWGEVGATVPIVDLDGALVRLVESQEQIATNRLVDTLEEQALLESLLDGSKPPLPKATSGLHYLLATPFRYPPLRHGSRFGRHFEPSLFYAAASTSTVLAESAYYRFVFWQGMTVAPSSALTTQHTLFGATWRCARGLQLQREPFEAWRDALTDPADYGATQRLGSAMRSAGVEAFEYVSARDLERGINVALFTPMALAVRRPVFTEAWLAETSADEVRFYSREEHRVHRFPLQRFLVDGRLPTPAV